MQSRAALNSHQCHIHITSCHVISRVCHKRHSSAQLLEAIIQLRYIFYLCWCSGEDWGVTSSIVKPMKWDTKMGWSFKIIFFLFLFFQIKQFSFWAQPLIHKHYFSFISYKGQWCFYLHLLVLYWNMVEYEHPPSYYIWVCTCMLSSQMV